MKNLRKLFALLMIAGAIFTMSACSEDDPAVEPEPKTTAELLVGNWVINATEGAIAVGPGEGSADWWFNTSADVTTRACLFDDVFTFGADGSFSLSLGGQTWLEEFQGGGQDGSCGTPVAPHDGSGSFTFAATDTSITLEGTGAFIGLAKVVNGGELPGASVPSSRTYKILAFDGESTPKTLKLDVAIAGDGHWTFNLISQ